MGEKEKEKEIEAPVGDEPAEAVPAAPDQGTADGGSDATAEAAKLKEQLAYLAAEFENFRKRVQREREAQSMFGNEQLLRAVLPFLDNLERAMGQAGASAESLVSGVRMTYDQFLAELRKFGLEQIAPAEGGVFDPTLHEAIARVPWEGKPEGTIVAETRKGYRLRGRLLRPAQVTVSVSPPAEAAAEDPGAAGE